MSCCCNNKVEDEEEEELEGPMENRSCTDVIFLILFIAYIIGMIILFGYGVATGDPNRIISGYDVAGDTCGAKNPVLVDVPYSGKDLTGKGLLFIDLVRTAQIQGDATLSSYLKNLSLPNTDLTSTLVDKIQFCIEGMNLGGSVNTTSRRKRETIL
ncbi:choline transporter-like protein 1, partial [Eurytemora carolleeae]|uniref:choline transporter-like protein 1 n=1 Tax=Eurytemora carolleeae TaxID=1294199 RepID=UPI000C762575